MSRNHRNKDIDQHIDRTAERIRSTELPQTYLGYRVTRRGYDLGPRAVRRFRRQVRQLALGDPNRFARALASWRGAMAF